MRSLEGHLDASSSHIDPSGVLICMSNISDHDIPLDNASSKDYVHIEGPDHKPAVKTEAALKGWQFIDPEKVIVGQGNCCNWTVKPRKALCGGIYAEPFYDSTIFPARAPTESASTVTTNPTQRPERSWLICSSSTPTGSGSKSLPVDRARSGLARSRLEF